MLIGSVCSHSDLSVFEYIQRTNTRTHTRARLFTWVKFTQKPFYHFYKLRFISINFAFRQIDPKFGLLLTPIPRQLRQSIKKKDFSQLSIFFLCLSFSIFYISVLPKHSNKWWKLFFLQYLFGKFLFSWFGI